MTQLTSLADLAAFLSLLLVNFKPVSWDYVSYATASLSSIL